MSTGMAGFSSLFRGPGEFRTDYRKPERTRYSILVEVTAENECDELETATEHQQAGGYRADHESLRRACPIVRRGKQCWYGGTIAVDRAACGPQNEENTVDRTRPVKNRSRDGRKLPEGIPQSGRRFPKFKRLRRS
jgi:hypothetical protein